MDICLTTDTPTSDSEDGAEASASSFGGPSLQSPGVSISEEEAQMAVSLTEYFQEQRRVYEHVCCLFFVCSKLGARALLYIAIYAHAYAQLTCAKVFNDYTFFQL